MDAALCSLFWFRPRCCLCRGVLVLCDPRLLNRGYGRVFLDSLPPFRRTRALADVQAFFAPQWAPVADDAVPAAPAADPAPGATFPLF